MSEITGYLRNFLPYPIGAPASATSRRPRRPATPAKTQIGWAAGVGLEYAMWSNWSIKLQCLYVDLGKFDCGVS